MTTDEQMQINQHDFVDSEIWDLIVNLYPERDDIKYNGNIVNKVRSVLSEYYVKELKVCTEEEFYPYIKEKKIKKELPTAIFGRQFPSSF